MAKTLEAMVKSVKGQQAVFDHDLTAAEELFHRRKKLEIPVEQSSREIAIDGVAHHVFNTLRGADDSIKGSHTFEDVRAIVARSF